MELLVVGGDKRHAALCELARARGCTAAARMKR